MHQMVVWNSSPVMHHPMEALAVKDLWTFIQNAIFFLVAPDSTRLNIYIFELRSLELGPVRFVRRPSLRRTAAVEIDDPISTMKLRSRVAVRGGHRTTR